VNETELTGRWVWSAPSRQDRIIWLCKTHTRYTYRHMHVRTCMKMNFLDSVLYNVMDYMDLVLKWSESTLSVVCAYRLASEVRQFLELVFIMMVNLPEQYLHFPSITTKISMIYMHNMYPHRMRWRSGKMFSRKQSFRTSESTVPIRPGVVHSKEIKGQEKIRIYSWRDIINA